MARLLAADDEAIATGARLLREGGLVVFPTETVYGLGADATNATAVARIFEAKRRPRLNPLIVHVADREAAGRLVVLNDAGGALAQAFWPGPLTLVAPRRPDCPVAALVSAGLDTLAVRVPAHPLAHALLEACAVPVAAPSANPSGRLSPTRARHVAEALGDAVDLILDGGPTEVGIESTIVDCSAPDPVLLRAGGVSRAMIETLLGARIADHSARHAERPSAPGQLASHYAPRARLRLAASEVRPGEALLAFGPDLPAGAGAAVMTLNLSETGDLRAAAANLFDMLHRLDASGAAAIAVMAIPKSGLGEAINDRLARAAAPRPAA